MVYAEEKIDGTIYKFPKVMLKYPEYDEFVMISELGGLNKYKNSYTDNSINVVNSYAVAFLHSLGVKRVTLSYELDDNKIKNLIDSYVNRYNKHPNLELVVEGYEEVMTSKYSLNKQYNKDVLFLRDMFNNKFKVVTKKGYMYIYNYRKREMFNKKYYDMGINALRINKNI